MKYLLITLLVSSSFLVASAQTDSTSNEVLRQFFRDTDQAQLLLLESGDTYRFLFVGQKDCDMQEFEGELKAIDRKKHRYAYNNGKCHVKMTILPEEKIIVTESKCTALHPSCMTWKGTYLIGNE